MKGHTRVRGLRFLNSHSNVRVFGISTGVLKRIESPTGQILEIYDNRRGSEIPQETPVQK